MREGALSFLVNLDDFVDTGLFLDHRLTRARVRDQSQDKDVLNLYAYTGSFTCAAALGGARRTVSVDRSETYLNWARDNLTENGLLSPAHTLVTSDAAAFLSEARLAGDRFDLIILDPPSFSTPGADAALDVQRDHPALIAACLELLRPPGGLWFSTNHQRFVPQFSGLQATEIVDLTAQTVPEDFRNRTAHRCFYLRR